MQTWKISAGLTVALAGAAVLAGSPRLEHFAPFWRLILADYGLAIALHLGLVLAAVAAADYEAARRRACQSGAAGRLGKTLVPPWQG